MKFLAIDKRLESDSLQRQCQLTEMYLLEIFAEICEKHNLQYFLEGGSLLGAIRHNGFIPWDDDIDIGMPIKDFNKFMIIAPNLLPDGILLQRPQQYAGDFIRHARIRDCKSLFCEPHTFIQNPSGIFIDIFPFEKFPLLPDKLAWGIIQFVAQAFYAEQAHRVYQNKSIFHMSYHLIMSAVWGSMAHMTKLTCKALSFVLPSRWNKQLGTLGLACSGAPDSMLFPLKTHIFEGRLYKIPNDADAYLTRMYGDWRTPPPPEKRGNGSAHTTVLILPTQAPNVWWAMGYKAE